jgi:competence ComEA-like helix-hairpin-helix protein
MTRLCRFVLAAGLAASAWAQDRAADAEGRTLLVKLCGGCHKVELVTSRRATKEQWQRTIQAMIDKGADGTDEQLNAVLDYLAKNYGPAKSAAGTGPPGKLNVNKASAEELASFLEIPASEAAAIVKYREKQGSLKDWRELQHVAGLDLKRVQAKKDRLEFQ